MSKPTNERKPDSNEGAVKKYSKALQSLADASANVLEGAKLGFEYLFTGVANSGWQIKKAARTALKGTVQCPACRGARVIRG